jgi:hypothetical protein
MSDTLSTITQFVNSPPGQLAAGGVLAGMVWKFFERVEGVLTDNTRHGIARWLRVRNIETGILAEEAVNWPDMFAQMFDRVFGERHVAWKCFLRSAGISTILYGFVFAFAFLHGFGVFQVRDPAQANVPSFETSMLAMLPLFLGVAIIGDYVSLLLTRGSIEYMPSVIHSGLFRVPLLWFYVLFMNIGWVGVVGYLVTIINVALAKTWWTSALVFQGHYHLSYVARYFFPPMFRESSVGDWLPFYPNRILLLWFYPAFFASIWLWLYATSGCLLKVARRFDIGFDWFNRHFDIEKKPLQSIGLVAGALVAIVYWAAVIVNRIV